MKTKKIITAVLICLCMILIFTGCAKKNPKVKVEMENGDIFVLELYPEYAPKTVDNFVKLVKDGFYDGLVFHRIVNNFMAQGGGFDVNDKKKQAESIEGEFTANGYTKNTLSHTKGVISMARVSGDNNSASSEFFIMLADGIEYPGYGFVSHSSYLDGEYAAFGKVIEGMEFVEKLQEVERISPAGTIDDSPSKPLEPVIIKKMTVVK